MELRQLEHFVRIAELGTLRGAAVTLGTTQPLLSRSLRRLEVELRQSLFERHGRGVTLTPAGRRLLDEAQGILQRVEVARAAVGSAATRLAGRVVIGLTPTLGRRLAAPIADRFLRELPDARLVLLEGLTTSLFDRLLLGRLDLALVFDPPVSEAVSLTPLGDAPLCLVERGRAARDATIGFRDAVAGPLILQSAPHPIRTLVEREAARLALPLDLRLEVDIVPAIVSLVRAGHGRAIVPGDALLDAGSREGLAVRRIVRPALSATLHLAAPVRRTTPPVVTAAAAIVRDLARRN